MSTVIGIDPSLSATGVAIDDRQAWTINTQPSDTTRLETIYDKVHYTVTTPGVDLVVIEDLPTHAKGAGLTGMAQGVIRLALVQARVRWLSVPPATLKVFATGKGSGVSKADMRMAWYQRTGADVRDDNQVDALFLQELGQRLLGTPTITLPQTHLRALAKVQLP